MIWTENQVPNNVIVYLTESFFFQIRGSVASAEISVQTVHVTDDSNLVQWGRHTKCKQDTSQYIKYIKLYFSTFIEVVYRKYGNIGFVGTVQRIDQTSTIDDVLHVTVAEELWSEEAAVLRTRAEADAAKAHLLCLLLELG